jgi:hypothetical protein
VSFNDLCELIHALTKRHKGFGQKYLLAEVSIVYQNRVGQADLTKIKVAWIEAEHDPIKIASDTEELIVQN